MKGKSTGTFIMVMLLVLVSSLAFAQTAPYSVTITPERALLQPGEGLQFEAQLFDANGKAVAFSNFVWHVRPDSMGEINEDGYFIAGKTPGEARVIASMRRGGVVYYGEAIVQIGIPEPPPIRILVTPENAVVPPGQTQKFHITAIARDNSNFKIDHVRWVVEPPHLGKISRDGVFQAGSKPGQGRIFAFVDINNAVYRGWARVTVSELPTASISGQVTDEITGEPLIGASILVQRLGAIHWMRKVRTDSSGNYVVGRLIPGLYIVRANARDYLPEYYDNASHLSEATPLQVSAHDSLTGIDFQLGHGATITGMVATELDSVPIHRALVTAIHVVTKRRRHAVTREDGSYALRSLPEGSYAIYFRAAGYKPEYYDNASRLQDATLLQTTPPDTISGIDVYLATSSAIAGQVIDAADGSPIARARVRIYTLVDRRMHQRYVAITDKNGNYIASVPPGFYIVQASAHGYRGEYYDDAVHFQNATPVQVFEDQHTTGIDFDLVKLGGITGLVTDQETGEPIAGATVIAFRERPTMPPVSVTASDGFRHVKTRTDSTGHYALENLPPGKYYVLAMARGYLPEFYQEAANLRDATPVEVTDSTTVENIDFTLSKGGSIAGTVYDAEDSTGIAGAAVTLWYREGGRFLRTFADQDGNYHFSGLPAGDYILFANQKGYDGKFYDGVDNRSEATPVTVPESGEVTGIDFYLPRFQTRMGTIAGVITEEPDSLSGDVGAPIVGAFVVAIPVSRRAPAHFDITDPYGNYRITNLIPGEYIILAWAPGYVGEFYDDARDWRDATLIPVEANQVVEGINLALAKVEPGPYRIRGVVRRRAGQNRHPVSGAVVYAFNQNGIAGSAVTDDNGVFVIEGLPAGRYKVKVTGVGMNTAFYGGTTDSTAMDVDLSNGQSAENIEIETEETTTAIGDHPAVLPEAFYLEQNYPNPFNPETTIKFALAGKSHVTIRIYNVLGQVVRTLVDRPMEAGFYALKWDATADNGQRVSSGVYIVRFEAGNVVQTRRMLLMK
ncbi:MAG: carboxypeptidase regulatory-like domain-containing protein [candidate division KSB1 bacterium]|nr:carboxypeptidase regulatory-like domain-containing protein [candidate division KSB1 bacterium]